MVVECLVAGVCAREVSEIARACWAVGDDGSYQEICDELNDFLIFKISVYFDVI